MKIVKRIKRGSFKGYTIRQSKYGWYAIYSKNGVSQTIGKLTLAKIMEIIMLIGVTPINIIYLTIKAYQTESFQPFIGDGYERTDSMRHQEDILQQACIRWMAYDWPKYSALLIHIPNGGKRNIKEAARFKSMGVRAGVPDLFLAVPCGFIAGLWIELKSEKGTCTDHQKEMQKRLVEAGYSFKLIRSLDEFIAIVDEYLTNVDEYLTNVMCYGIKPKS